MKDIKPTRSICPECLKAIDATIYEDDGKVFIKKDCPEHGHFQELYWSDYDQYVRAEKFRYDGDGMSNPRTEKKNGCPYDCGICPEHKSHTALAIIDVTNRCNLTCPVCFANAAAAGYVYEPTKEQIIRHAGEPSGQQARARNGAAVFRRRTNHPQRTARFCSKSKRARLRPRGSQHERASTLTERGVLQRTQRSRSQHNLPAV